MSVVFVAPSLSENKDIVFKFDEKESIKIPVIGEGGGVVDDGTLTFPDGTENIPTLPPNPGSGDKGETGGGSSGGGTGEGDDNEEEGGHEDEEESGGGNQGEEEGGSGSGGGDGDGDGDDEEEKDITKVVIPDSVIEIKDNSFVELPGLEEVVFEGESRLKDIGSFAFAFTNLGKFDIPKSVETIGTNPFAGCQSLKSISVPVVEDPKFVSNGFMLLEKDEVGGYKLISFACGSGETVVLDGVTDPKIYEIGDYAFYGCWALQWPKIFPNDAILTKIGNYSFGKTGLTEINLPSSVEGVDKFAFYHCDNLKKLTCGGSGPLSFGDHAFLSTGMNGLPCQNETPTNTE
eukprot:gnl/Chilomastix_caulleri/888.p1 GENE.gnl/Chilomastix_caulleri/888~~gnl/Chilomastix_caulleri/888.p1  ORF type:complete len:368 (+),score=147.64 gnl/Chilomastix_caulleri/888:65-1105(+)